MSFWRQLKFGWSGLRNQAGRAQEIADEVEQYFEEAEAEWRARGLSSSEAKKAARLEWESIAVARERASEYGWENAVKLFVYDLRFALRQLLKRPVFATTTALTLALGIGANTAIFTVVERVLLAPLPYKNADRLAAIKTYRSQLDATVDGVTGPDTVDLRQQAASLAAVSLYSGGSLGVQLKDHAAYTVVTLADENFGRVFQLSPIAGRLFTNAEAKHAALVSERFARDNFGTVQAALGQVLHVESAPVQIVGIIGGGFDFPAGTQVWLASPMVPESMSRTAFNYRAVARLRAGSSFRSAQTEANVISERLRAVYAHENHGKAIVLQPLKQSLTGHSRPTLLFLWASAVLILLIACVNVMHLQLVRSLERQRELAVRKALGCSGWRMMQPLVLEMLLVALLGGVAGLLLALPAVRELVALAPAELPRASEIHLNFWVFAFALGLAVATAAFSAISPAIRAANVDPVEALKADSSRGMTKRSAGLLRSGLVVAEVAATFVLVAGAGLLLRTMLNLQARDMGYATRQMLVVDADAPAQGEIESRRAVQQFSELFEQLRQLPGVTHVAGVMGLPTGSYGSNGYYEVGGGRPVDAEHPSWSNFTVASAKYFETMDIPLRAGRDFRLADAADGNMVAIVSETLARQSFGEADPVGRLIRCGLDSDKWMTIVGVVGDVRQNAPGETPGPALYMPMAQHPFYANQIHVVLRTQVQPLTLMTAVDARMARINPGIARRYTTMDAMVNHSIATEKFRAALISSFAGLGMLLAMLGVYGTMAHSVAQRRFEFGVRIAFGAERMTILRIVLGHAVRMVCLGIAIGSVFALGFAKLITSMLVGVKPTDPVSLILVSLVLMITALVAAFAPGWRATQVNPVVALRAD